MISRITNQSLLATSQQNMQAARAGLAELQNQAGSQKQITKPSDDPNGSAESMRIRSEQRALAQYGINVSDGLGWLTIADTALSDATSTLQKVRDLIVQGGNGALGPQQREALALQLDELKPELMRAANASYAGRPVFAGNSDAGAAFQPDGSYTGVVGSTVERRIGATTTMRVDVDGSAVFGTGATSAFALIDDIAADLRSGAPVTSHLDTIDDRLDLVIGAQSSVGARYAQLEHTKELSMEKAGFLESQRADIEDVDLGSIILQLKTQELAYQTALSVTARSLQPTLMSFLA